MILGEHPTILNVDAFMAGLQQARQGVVQVGAVHGKLQASNFSLVCTGWLLTEQLVVVPAHVLNGGSKSDFYCRQQLANEPSPLLEAELLFAPDLTFDYGKVDVKNKNWLSPGLLRLKEPLSASAILHLETGLVRVDDQLSMLQFVGSLPGLSLSVGKISGLEDGRLSYRASSLPGSAGAPLFSTNWQVIGMHSLATQTGQHKDGHGATLSELLDGLRAAPVWPNIVAYHKLADLLVTPVQQEVARSLSASQSVAEPNLLRAAVFWDVDPVEFTDDELKKLKLLAANPLAKRLTLRAEERQRLLESAPSLAVLQQERNKPPATHAVLQQEQDKPPATQPTDARQTVIDRILQGPPFDLSGIAETDLPYWLQAVRWFANVVPDLPTPKAINQTLQRRRVRSQFNPIVKDFRGRTAELKTFTNWFNNSKAGPMVVTGIGGVGKSSLVARFALNLPAETLLLWLDFDRADLAPDDARSVLTQLSQQASVQINNFAQPELPPPSPQEKDTNLVKLAKEVTQQAQQAAEQVGAELAKHLSGAVPPLLVLDGFEVAQHARHHNEIWNVLESVLKKLPALRVIVSGRAEVSGLWLAGRKARSMHLTGIPRPDARSWLHKKGITDGPILEQVLDIADGVPLNLKLAVRLAEEGDDFADLPKTLQQEMVSGYLHRRILERVLDPEIQATNLVADVLVLRRITPALLGAVVSERLPTGLTPDEVFDRLKNALDVVDTQSVFTNSTENTSANAEKAFWLRPELRIATLRLLETADADRVRGIDERAAHWYAQKDPENIVYAAELVYHRLRLGDIPGTEAAWRNDCIELLQRAEENLQPTATKERQWLRERLKAANTTAHKLGVWEREAAERIQDKLSRGLHSDLAHVLGERKGRSKGSPLVFYDAWLRYSTGDVDGARTLLKNADKTEGSAGRDQTVLAALLARQVGDYPEADQLLAQINDESHWADRSRGNREALAVKAARVRLTVDVAAELDLISLLQKPDQPLAHNLTEWLRPSDVLLPQLQSLLSSESKYQSSVYRNDQLTISASVADLKPFRKQLEVLERKMLDSQWIKQLLDSDASASLSLSVKLPAWASKLMASFDREPSPAVVKLLATLAVLSQQRKQRITEDLFLHQAVSELNTIGTVFDPLGLSIGASLVGLSGLNLALSERHYWQQPDIKYPQSRVVGDLNDLIQMAGYEYFTRFADFSTPTRFAQVETLVGLCDDNEVVMDWLATLRQAKNQQYAKELAPQPRSQNTDIATQLDQMNVIGPLLYLLGPDPLEMLCKGLLFLPASYHF